MPLKRSTFLLTFLKLSSIFSCLLSTWASVAFLGLGPGLALGAFGSLGGFGALGTFGGLGSLGSAGLPLFLAGATTRDRKEDIKQKNCLNWIISWNIVVTVSVYISQCLNNIYVDHNSGNYFRKPNMFDKLTIIYYSFSLKYFTSQYTNNMRCNYKENLAQTHNQLPYMSKMKKIQKNSTFFQVGRPLLIHHGF